MNIGLNLLCILLTLGVVMNHFWWRPDPGNLRGVDVALWQLRTLAVPAFMTMTFFFTARRFVGGDVAWLKKRYVRLYEPFVFWAVACWAKGSATGWLLETRFEGKNECLILLAQEISFCSLANTTPNTI